MILLISPTIQDSILKVSMQEEYADDLGTILMQVNFSVAKSLHI